MKKLSLSTLASHMISLSVMNDIILFGSGSIFSLAKLLFILACVVLLMGVYSLRRLSIVDLLVFTFCFFCLLFTVLFSGGGVGERFISVATSFVIGCASYFIITRSLIRYDDLVSAFIFWVGISSLLAVFQSFTGYGFFTDRIFLSTMLPSLYRASGFMADPNYFSLICLLGFSLCLGYRKKGIALWLCLLGIILSGSRSGIIFLIFIFVINKLDFKLSFNFIFRLIVSLSLTLMLLYFFRYYLPESVSMIFDPSSYSDGVDRNSLYDRTLAIQAGVVAFFDNPIFGFGIGNLTSHPLNYHGQMSHNTIIEILSENGLIGLFLYVLLIIFLFRYLGRSLESSSVRSKAMVNCLAVTQMMSMTIVIHYSRIMFFVFSLVVIACISYEGDERNE